MYGFIILLVANLGFFSWRYWSSIPPTEVKITYPNDGSIVEIKEIQRVLPRGFLKNIQSGLLFTLMLLIATILKVILLKSKLMVNGFLLLILVLRKMLARNLILLLC